MLKEIGISRVGDAKLRAALEASFFAAAVVLVALLLRIGLDGVLGRQAPFITFFPAVLVAAILGGWISGLIAVALTLIAGKAYVIWIGSAAGHPHAFTALLYVAGCGVSIFAAEKMRRASERYRQAEHKLATALDISGVGTWRWDIVRDRVEWDDRLCRMLGLAPAAAPKTVAELLELVHEDDRAAVLQKIQTAMRDPQASECLFRIRHAHKGVRWIADRNNVLCSPNGRPLEMVGASMDVTERKQADEDRDLLIRELHHRVRNTLAIVQGMANVTANSAPDLAHFKETFARRIASLAMTHALLTDEKSQSTTLSRLVRQELEALGMLDRLELTGADFLLPSDVAVPLGMAIHELATNALKYGALSEPAGAIRLSCALSDETAEIVWTELNGPAVNPPSRRGFGAQLLDRVIEVQLGAATSRIFAPEGLRVTISIPREKLSTGAAAQKPAPALQAQAG